MRGDHGGGEGIDAFGGRLGGHEVDQHLAGRRARAQDGVSQQTLVRSGIPRLEPARARFRADGREDGIADLTVKFDRQLLQDFLCNDDVEIRVEGQLTTGELFSGIDGIRVK